MESGEARIQLQWPGVDVPLKRPSGLRDRRTIGLNLLFFDHRTPSIATGSQGSSLLLVISQFPRRCQCSTSPRSRLLIDRSEDSWHRGSLLVDCSSSRKRSGSYPRKEDQPTNLLIVLSNSFPSLSLSLSLSVQQRLLTIAHCRGSKILET